MLDAKFNSKAANAAHVAKSPRMTRRRYRKLVEQAIDTKKFDPVSRQEASPEELKEAETLGKKLGLGREFTNEEKAKARFGEGGYSVEAYQSVFSGFQNVPALPVRKHSYIRKIVGVMRVNGRVFPVYASKECPQDFGGEVAKNRVVHFPAPRLG